MCTCMWRPEGSLNVIIPQQPSRLFLEAKSLTGMKIDKYISLADY